MRGEFGQQRSSELPTNMQPLQVWREINYLDSMTSYRECLPGCDSRPVRLHELEFIEDQAAFPWSMVIKFSSLAAAVCILLLILSLNI
jgi:hypothetical protein